MNMMLKTAYLGENLQVNEMKNEAKLFIPDVIGTGLMAVGNLDMPPANTIQINNCEKIILRQSGIDVKFELDNDNIRKFKQMYINGIGFVRSESFFEELEDRLPKNKKLDKYDILDIIQDLLEEWKQ